MSEFPDRKFIWQVARFLVVGVIATGADLITYLLLLEAGAATGPAKTFSYITGTLLGFLGNKFWTFGSKRRSIAEPITYGALYLTTLVVNVGVNALVLQILTGALTPAWERDIAFVIATGTTTALNFLGLRFLTFGASRQSPNLD